MSEPIQPLSPAEQIEFLASELAEEKRSTLRMVARLLNAAIDFKLDPRMISVLESWAVANLVDPDEWRGFLASNPLAEPIDRGGQVLELLEQLRAVATVVDAYGLESLLGRIQTVYLIEPSALAELDIHARSLVQQVCVSEEEE